MGGFCGPPRTRRTGVRCVGRARNQQVGAAWQGRGGRCALTPWKPLPTPCWSQAGCPWREICGAGAQEAKQGPGPGAQVNGEAISDHDNDEYTDYMEQDSMEFHESVGAPTAPIKAAAK